MVTLETKALQGVIIPESNEAEVSPTKILWLLKSMGKDSLLRIPRVLLDVSPKVLSTAEGRILCLNNCLVVVKRSFVTIIIDAALLLVIILRVLVSLISTPSYGRNISTRPRTAVLLPATTALFPVAWTTPLTL